MHEVTSTNPIFLFLSPSQIENTPPQRDVSQLKNKLKIKTLKKPKIKIQNIMLVQPKKQILKKNP